MDTNSYIVQKKLRTCICSGIAYIDKDKRMASDTEIPSTRYRQRNGLVIGEIKIPFLPP